MPRKADQDPSQPENGNSGGAGKAIAVAGTALGVGWGLYKLFSGSKGTLESQRREDDHMVTLKAPSMELEHSLYNSHFNGPLEPSTTTPYDVYCDGKTIVTTVTKKADEANKWIRRVLSVYANVPRMVVGLDVEWKPNLRDMTNPPATLQLCIDTQCLILQLFHMDNFPQTLKGFLLNPKFTFVGVEVDKDISKLRLKCDQSYDIQKAAMEIRYYDQPPGLKTLAKEVVGLHMDKPKVVTLSNWEARELNENQVEYACVDAYASFKIGHKLFFRG